MKFRLAPWVPLVLVVLVGCGEDKKDEAGRKLAAAAEGEQVKFSDWPSVELRNGLVKLRVVPKLGARLMSFEFDGRPLLYANPKRLGHLPGDSPEKHQPLPVKTDGPATAHSGKTTASADGTAAPAASPAPPPAPEYVNYGGACVWPLPTSLWSQPWPPPAALDLGDCQPELSGTTGDQIKLALTAPADPALGFKLTRSLVLDRAASVVTVVSRLTNTSKAAVTLALQDLSQHPGVLGTGETFSQQVRAYLPLNAASPLDKHFAALRGKDGQWQVDDRLLTVTYGGEEALAGSDSTAGWVAWADAQHEVVCAKVATLAADGKYPDKGLTATVYTAPSAKESYLGLALRSPLTEVAPEKALEFAVSYGAAHCPLPIVGASRAGVVNTPLSVVKLKDTATVKGIFGVFYAGYAQVAFLDKAGVELGRTEQVSVSPLTAYRLDTVVPVPDGAVKAVLRILTRDRTEVAALSEALLGEPPTTPAPTTPKTTPA